MKRWFSLAVVALAALVGFAVVVQPASGVARAARLAPVPLRVGSWNVCAEFAECPAVGDATGRVNRMAAFVNDNTLDALLLQEVCEWHVSRLLTTLGSGWSASFAPLRRNDVEGGWPGRHVRICGSDRYALGVAVVVRGGADQPTTYALPSPTARYSFEAPVLCVRRASPAVRLCSGHFTPDVYDTSGALRTAQRARMVQLVQSFGTEKTVFGGDLNLLPPSGSFTPPGTALGGSDATLDPLYDLMRECDQRDGLALTGAPRAGESTAHWGSASAPTWGKIDYLFATPYAADPAATFTTCDAISHIPSYQTYSDHLPLFGFLQL